MNFEKTPFANVHPILGNALRAVPEERRPPPPYHLGGPQPVLSCMAQAAIGIGCAERMAGHIPGEQRAEYDNILEAARKLYPRRLAWQKERRHPPDVIDDQTARELLRLAKVGRNRPGLFPLAPLAISALNARPDLVGTVLRASMKRIGETLNAEGRFDELREFLLDLDREVVRRECQEASEQYAPAGTLVERVIWRADRGNGRAGHFLFRIAGRPTYGLITKLAGRWRWVEGGRDEVLATIPDQYFEGGVEAYFAAER